MFDISNLYFLGICQKKKKKNSTIVGKKIF